jgi:hypothetical protein
MSIWLTMIPIVSDNGSRIKQHYDGARDAEDNGLMVFVHLQRIQEAVDDISV